MASRQPKPTVPLVPDEPPALHARAIQDLSYIRRTMEGASSFTDVPGWGLVAIGVSAIGASYVAATQESAGRWITVWLVEAVIAAAIGIGMTWRKMRRRTRTTGAPMMSAPARKFLFGFWPPILAGAVLTAALIDPVRVWDAYSTVPRVLPGVWLLLYGVGVMTAGAFSVRAVPLMGAGLILLGAFALLVHRAPENLLLALGFGPWQIAFGIWIARRHGG
jgi:hypothetical protein